MAQLSKRSQEGYLLIDHRNSPGVPESLVQAATAAGKPPGVAVSGGITYESATITCAHCQRGVILNPDRSRPRGYCAKCDHYVCDNPACNKDCTPFAKILDQAQALAFQAEQSHKGTIYTPPPALYLPTYLAAELGRTPAPLAALSAPLTDVE